MSGLTLAPASPKLLSEDAKAHTPQQFMHPWKDVCGNHPSPIRVRLVGVGNSTTLGLLSVRK